MKSEAEKHGHVSTPVLKAIKNNCIECSGGSFSEVDEGHSPSLEHGHTDGGLGGFQYRFY